MRFYSDAFLPRVTDLAISSSDRQTKVAACELLHALFLYMLGSSSQQSEDLRKKVQQHLVLYPSKIFDIFIRNSKLCAFFAPEPTQFFLYVYTITDNEVEDQIFRINV